MSGKESWGNFVSRVEEATAANFGFIKVEILTAGDCLPGPIVAKRGNMYVCETAPNPQDEDDYAICVVVGDGNE